MFRVADVAGVLRAEGTSSEGSEGDRKEKERERRRIYSIPGFKFHKNSKLCYEDYRKTLF